MKDNALERIAENALPRGKQYGARGPSKRMVLCLIAVSMIALRLPAGEPRAREPRAGQPLQQPAVGLDRSLINEAYHAIRRAKDWLASLQKDNGGWSDDQYPALTALPLWAFAGGDYPGRQATMERAVEHILSYVQPNGGIYRHIEGRRGGGLSNYNTAICMKALHAVGDQDLVPVILDARRFLAAAQHLGGDQYDGGMGYDRLTDRAYADLNNTVIAYEAMRLTEQLEEFRPADQERADLDWAAARRFLARLQHTEDVGIPEQVGGFFYRPETDPKAGVLTNETGTVIFRAYGSMTYAGMLSLIYADVSRNDSRVRSAFDWAMRHWTLEENPGAGPEGVYYFYNVLTKALAAFGRDRIPADETEIFWRRELVRKLLNLQRIDPATGHGYWLNDHGRYLESDPVLVTSYAILALQMALGGERP